MRSSLKALLIMVVSFFVLVVGSAIFFGGMYLSYSNEAVSKENKIEADYKNNQNIYSNYTTKIQEMSGLSETYKNDLKEVVKAAMSGRYGKDGSKAVFQFIKENSTHLSPDIYKQISTTIQAGRAEFQNAQSQLVDDKRSYKVMLQRPVSGFFLRLAGYPKTDLSKYDIITTQDTQQKFKTKTDSAIKFRQ